jgi:site-specific DNA-adenine methylase
MMRFNLKFEYNQTFGKRTFNPSTEKKLNDYIEYITPYKDKILFSSKSFSEIKITKPSMIYIDPPYTGSEAGYNVYWKKNNDNDLYKYCKELDRN